MLLGSSQVYLLRDLSKPTTIADLAICDTLPEPVFTFDGTRITVGLLERVVSCGKAPVITVVFDNHSGLHVTADQPFLLFDGTPCLAKDLTPGKSLMPLYLGQNKRGYPTYRENTSYHLNAETEADCQKERKTARMVAEHKIGARVGSKIHVNHIDGSKYNCHPDNLAVTHKSDAKQRKFIHPFVKAVLDAKKIIESHPKNHKVVEVLQGEQHANVYGCVVSPWNNIAIGGVFLQTANDE